VFNKTVSVIVFLLFVACSSKAEFLPGRILEYSLNEKLSGEKAKSFVNKLHYQEVASLKNEIGFYSKGNQKAIIYVTYYNDAQTAVSEENKMTQKISPQNSVFMGGEYLNIHDFEVYRCFGLGQTHFVFSHDSELFWISVDTMDANDFLKQYFSLLQ